MPPFSSQLVKLGHRKNVGLSANRRTRSFWGCPNDRRLVHGVVDCRESFVLKNQQLRGRGKIDLSIIPVRQVAVFRPKRVQQIRIRWISALEDAKRSAASQVVDPGIHVPERGNLYRSTISELFVSQRLHCSRRIGHDLGVSLLGYIYCCE